ncbi:hypothetical protein [Nocardia bovistercoris]|uniref:Esterase n=1 Tax=Nocardia bovistercoris TaxID=2785916 RepID=A0A931I8V4_9NOCA|nr:hypothetical protein [Nocardia bovistercoris]MBH0775495.1 hypothetical protein [Nocardia bovistercoris]
MKFSKLWLLVGAVLLAAITGAVTVTHALAQEGDPTLRERRCVDEGWRHVVLDVAGRSREVLWKGPAGAWPKGAIIAMHGGGGEYDQWCGRDSGIAAPQVRFGELAVADGFGIFLVNSSDEVSDEQGRVCGKVWDDEVRGRPNLDLPFLEQVMRQTIPGSRPAGSADAVFLTGLSSGGYMTVRAATHFNGLVKGFAPVSSGDPYGWHRVCEAGLTPRVKVEGAGYDNETGKQIIESDACRSESYPNEVAWDEGKAAVKPTFRMFHHELDGINDLSCADKVVRQLRAHGYPGEPDFLLHGGRRGLANHLWQDDYNRPILDFFTSRLGS